MAEENLLLLFRGVHVWNTANNMEEHCELNKVCIERVDLRNYSDDKKGHDVILCEMARS